MNVVRDKDAGVRIQGNDINNLKFAHYIDIIEGERNKLQENIIQVRIAGEAAGLKIGKTKTTVG